MHRSLLALAVGLSSAACAHATTTPPPTELPSVVWPPPPAAPRARLAEVMPRPAVSSPPRSLWRRALDLVIGSDAHGEAPPRLLERPFGVAVGPGGDVLVADPDGASVTRFLRDGKSRRVDCPDEPWGAPMAVEALEDGSVVVADAGTAQLTWIDPDGRCRLLGGGEFERPTGIAVRGDRIYVADPPRHTVAVLDKNGAVVARFGRRGEGEGELSFPSSVALMPNGEVLVVDALNFRIARFSSDGRWLGAFGHPGDVDDGFERPKGIAVGDGRIYVSDAQRDEVLVFDPSGVFEYALGDSGTEPGHLAHPAGMAVRAGWLWVADSQNARVQAFALIVGGGS